MRIIILLALLCVGCSGKDCQEEREAAKAHYESNLLMSGNSQAAINENTAQYNKQIAEINERCN